MASDLMGELIEVTRKNRVQYLTEELLSDFNRQLYGDDIQWSERSFWYKSKFYATRYRDRVRDAWAVLTGRAGIGD